MAHLPPGLFEKEPTINLPIFNVGKVRNTYGIPHRPDLMFPVTSDRASIFDLVLNTTIDQKGEVLNALNHLVCTQILGEICETDFVDAGSNIQRWLPEGVGTDLYLQKRGTVVKRHQSPEEEDIARSILTGTGLKDYLKTGMVGGHRLPKDLHDGSRLPFVIYTPSTKATEGHDINITADEVVAKRGYIRERTVLQAFGLIASYAEKRGIILADTKFEFAGKVIIDEKGTPDSSRFVDKKAWEKAVAKGKFPASLDKQFLREWGKLVGIDKLDPKNPEHRALVHAMVIPDDTRNMTTAIYRYICSRLTEKKLERYQRENMGIDVQDHRLRIEVLVGSRSDLPQILAGAEHLETFANSRVSIISCHRNPQDLANFASGDGLKADIVIAAAGKAAALPGVVKSLLLANGSKAPVIGVALKGATVEDDRDATGSIEGLPGQPVELDRDGKAYFGAEGFQKACFAAITDEFLPKTMEAKAAEMGVNFRA